jgi:hypothetical protein
MDRFHCGLSCSSLALVSGSSLLDVVMLGVKRCISTFVAWTCALSADGHRKHCALQAATVGHHESQKSIKGGIHPQRITVTIRSSALSCLANSMALAINQEQDSLGKGRKRSSAISD